MTPPIDVIEDPAEVRRQVDDLIDSHQLSLPITVISDLSVAKVDFSDLVIGMASALRNGPSGGSVWNAELTNILVGSGPLVRLLANSMGQQQYGGVKVEHFESLDQALEHAKRTLERAK
ncbi:MAG: hypothetical protein GYB68_20040 [Chloroflexi bacterium]|nr:hypothetical protein [Chloroflexota bacterium]